MSKSKQQSGQELSDISRVKNGFKFESISDRICLCFQYGHKRKKEDSKKMSNFCLTNRSPFREI